MTASSDSNERLTTTVLGLRLSNPILVASGPLTDSLVQIRNCMEAGAGGVVTKTIFIGKEDKVNERVRKCSAGLLNSTTYSHRPFEDWLRVLALLAEEQTPVITSIYAHKPKELAELARLVVRAGAPALELGLCCPNDGFQNNYERDLIKHFAAAVRESVEVPFSVKLTAGLGILEHAQAAIDGGAYAISLSDALPSILVDVKSRKIALGGPVGYSGPGIKPVVLHSLYQLRKNGVECPILGIGGISTASDVLEYLQVGATAVQLYTSLVTSGLKLLGSIIGDLSVWCEGEGIHVRQLVGAAVYGSTA